MTVKERPGPEVLAQKGLVDLAGRHGRRHGEVAAGDALPEAHEVGAQVALLAGEQRPGATEPGGDLVADEEGPRPPAGLSEPPDVGRVGAEHARGPLDEGLDDDRGQLACVRLDRGAGLVAPRGLGVARRAQHGEAKWVEDRGLEPAVAERECADGVPVVGVSEREEPVALGSAKVGPVLERDLERLLDGRRAVGGEEEPGTIDGHHDGERLGQLHHLGRTVPEHRRVGHATRLLDECGVELRHAMAQGVDPQ